MLGKQFGVGAASFGGSWIGSGWCLMVTVLTRRSQNVRVELLGDRTCRLGTLECLCRPPVASGAAHRRFETSGNLGVRARATAEKGEGTADELLVVSVS